MVRTTAGEKVEEEDTEVTKSIQRQKKEKPSKRGRNRTQKKEAEPQSTEETASV